MLRKILDFLLRYVILHYRRRVKRLKPGGRPALHMALASDVEFSIDFDREDEKHGRRLRRLEKLRTLLEKLSR